MRSNGGAITPDGVRELPVSMVRSGPAGGVIAAVFVAEAVRLPNVILADMGGTSFDVCLIARGRPVLTTEAKLEWGIPYCSQWSTCARSAPAAGRLRGWMPPASSMSGLKGGGRPGPACYARGGEEPTVTDANLVLGRLGADLSLAGDVLLDTERAREAVRRVAEPMEISVEEAAHGILEIADHNMAQELRLISIDQGLDPRDFALMSFGGAGPLHAGSLATALRMRYVIVPIFPGAFSAFGALIADTRFDYLRTTMIQGLDDVATVTGLFGELEERARADLIAQGHVDTEPLFERRVDLRYRGQAWELEITIDGGISTESLAAARGRFHTDHQSRFGWSLEEMALECVNFKLAATINRQRPVLPTLDEGPRPEPVRHREVRFKRGTDAVAAPVYWRADLRAGNVISGPAVIAEAISTTLLWPGDALRVDALGNLLIDLQPWGAEMTSTATTPIGPPHAVDAADPIVLAILRSGLKMACEEMGRSMMRTAWSPIFNEGKDLSCMIFDHGGEMLAQGDFCPSHIGATVHIVEWAIKEVGPENLEPGDVILHNDPYRGGATFRSSSRSSRSSSTDGLRATPPASRTWSMSAGASRVPSETPRTSSKRVCGCRR